MRVAAWSSETCCALPSPLPCICPLTPLPTNTHLINSPGSLVTSWILIDLHQFVSHQGFPEQRCLCHIIHNIYALIRLEKNSPQSVCHSLGYRAERHKAARKKKKKQGERQKETNDKRQRF